MPDSLRARLLKPTDILHLDKDSQGINLVAAVKEDRYLTSHRLAGKGATLPSAIRKMSRVDFSPSGNHTLWRGSQSVTQGGL